MCRPQQPQDMFWQLGRPQRCPRFLPPALLQLTLSSTPNNSSPQRSARGLKGVPARGVAVEPAHHCGVEGRAMRMEQMADVPQLQLHFVDHIQWRYEVIRPIVLLQDRTATQRAEETHTHPETVRKLTRRFRQQGILGLLPDHTDIVVPSRGRHVPAAVVEEMARLKALYDGFQYRELARIIFYKLDYRIDDKTVKKLWQQSPVPVQGELPFGAYHSHAERTQARLQVIKLYYQGWSKRSISHFLRVSRPTVDRWIHRFEAEHVAGLADKSRAPKAPTRKVWLPLMLQIYHLQAPSRCGCVSHLEPAGQRHDFRADGGTRDGLKPAGLR